MYVLGVCACVYAHVCARMQVCVCMCVHLCMCIMQVCVCVCLYACVHLEEHVYLSVHCPYSPPIQVAAGPCGNVSRVTTYKNENTGLEPEKINWNSV